MMKSEKFRLNLKKTHDDTLFFSPSNKADKFGINLQKAW